VANTPIGCIFCGNFELLEGVENVRTGAEEVNGGPLGKVIDEDSEVSITVVTGGVYGSSDVGMNDVQKAVGFWELRC
jgi:hypothetical protein